MAGNISFDHIGEEVRNGKLAVIPTDTLYGIVTSVHKLAAIEQLYQLRNRPDNQACVVLVASADDIEAFKVAPNLISLAKAFWPGPISLVLEVGDGWDHVARGGNTIAFRVPDHPSLTAFLKASGPVIAPSANKSGQEPARSYLEARQTFGDEVDIYVDGGEIESSVASTVAQLHHNGRLEILRQGKYVIEQRV